MTDSLRNEARARETARLESEFIFDQERDSLAFAQAQERLRFEFEAEEQAGQQRLTYIGLGLTSLLLLLSVVFFFDKQRNNRKLAKANLQLGDANEELKVANEEIRSSHEETQMLNESLQDTLDLVQRQKDNITDSINYAQRIQVAILPSQKRLERALPEHFLFFEPRDIVSGDFYWLSDLGTEESKVIFAAIDCTGHGVPGAFMSMIGNDLLNHLVNERRIFDPGLILTQLHLDIQRVLNQEETSNRDGMDMTLLVWDKATNQLQFAGAKNPLVYVQNGELHQIKGDRTPIGGYQHEKERIFTTHTLSLSEGEIMAYIFSDGFQDQFGGEKDRKFGGKRLRNLCLSVAHKPMEEQKAEFSQAFKAWKGDTKQIDDVLLMGVRVQ